MRALDLAVLEDRVLLSAAPVPAMPPGGEVLVNETIPQRQQNADVAEFADGSFVAVWEADNDGDAQGVYGRLFDSSGTAIGPEFRINQTASDKQTDPAVAIDDAGNFIVAWTSMQTGEEDIYARIFDSSGAPQSNEILVNSGYVSSKQQNADIASDAAGNFVVVWEGHGPGDPSGIFGQQFFAGGATNGGLFRASTTTANNRDNAAVAMNSSGEFVVTWTQNGGGGSTIRGRHYNSAGMAQPEFPVQATPLGDADRSAVAIDDSGEFVVAWQEQNVDGNGSAIRMRRFDSSGGALSGDLQVNTTTTGDQTDPALARDGDGHFIVSWTSKDQDGDAEGVFLRAFDPDGTPAGGELQANTFAAGSQRASRISLNDSGQLTVVWEGESATDSDDVHARLYAWPDAVVNTAPTAARDSYSVNENSVLSIAASGVLANDVDAEGDPLSALLVSGPANGGLTLNANGSFVYTPNSNFSGVDAFTYLAYDGARGSSPATVNITVNPTNSAPVAFDDSYATPLLLSLNVSAPGVLGNDFDSDGDPLTALLVSGPSLGTLFFNSDGSFTFVPPLFFWVSTSFTYRVSDGAALSNVATVFINGGSSNNAPMAGNNSYSVAEDSLLSVPAAGVLADDGDFDGDSLTALLVSGPTNGGLTLNANGSFVYTPSSNFNGVDSFTYRASDGSLSSNLATVTISVTPVNDAPLAIGDSFNAVEDSVLNIAPAGVLANDIDADGNPLTSLLVNGPGKGSLLFNADGSFSYAPNPNFSGVDSFAYRASDGTATSNLATVILNIAAVNDAPSAVDDSYLLAEDSTLTVTGPTGLLSNDFDAEGDPLSAVLATGPANGSLALNTDGSFTYTPNADFNGTDSFTYRANDGSLNSSLATVTLTVAAANDAPTAADDTYSMTEDGLLNIPAAGVLANDVDLDGDPLAAVLVNGPTRGILTLNADGSLTYAPASNFSGTDSFTYRAADGSSSSNLATVTIGVASVNDAPTAAAESYSLVPPNTLVTTVGVLANDADIEGDPLTCVLVADAANGQLTLNADGTFTYVPAAGFTGIDTFTYAASDGMSQSNAVTVTITVGITAPPIAPPLPTDGTPNTDNTDTQSTTPQQTTPTVAGVPTAPPPQTNATGQPRSAPSPSPAAPPSPVRGDNLVAVAATPASATENSLEPSSIGRHGAPSRGAAPRPTGIVAAAAAFDVGLLWNDLAELEQQIAQNGGINYFTVGAAAGASSALTVGYVLWTLRGGSLVIGLMAQMPAWRLIDPLVVLDYLEEDSGAKKPDEEEEDSLQGLLQRAEKRADHETSLETHTVA